MTARVLSYGILVRPCWMNLLPWRRVTVKNFSFDDETDDLKEGKKLSGFVYFDIEGDEAHRFRTYQEPGVPPNIWAPNGFEIPEDADKGIEALVHETPSRLLIVLDPEWFEKMSVMHDGLARDCKECKSYRLQKKFGI